MRACRSCKEAMHSCITSQKFAFTHLYKDEKTMDVHIHDCYEIYYAISGGKQFLIDGKFYDIHDGDIFFINQYESHYLSQVDQAVHDRIVIAVHPDYLNHLSSAHTDLDYCFHSHNDSSPHKIHLLADARKRFLYFIHKLGTNEGFGEDILDQAVFAQLMVFLNKAYHKTGKENEAEPHSQYHTQVDAILAYINQNIQGNLSIDALAAHFYLSSSYICRIFKSTTGTTINKYITAKRITISKELLSEGYSVYEVCEKSGFKDYSNYLKAFQKAVGITPKKYAQFNL